MKRLMICVVMAACTLALPAQSPRPGKAEAADWEKLRSSPAIKDYEAFLAKYPKGSLAPLAQAKLVALKRAEEAANPSRLLVRDKLETREEYAARIAGLKPLPVGRGAAKVENYDVDTRRLALPFTPDPWATDFFKAGRLTLEVDRDLLRKWLAADPTATLFARFEVRDGAAQPVEVSVQTPLGPLPLADDLPPVPGAVRNAAGLWEARVALKGSSLTLVQVPAGSFTMGSPGKTGPERAFPVTISRDFWVGQVPVTLAQWEAVLGGGAKPAEGSPNRPKPSVSWNDAQMFLEKLNWAQSVWTFRLPTEAEWEYACRAGSPGAWYGDADAIAWHSGNSGKASHPVGEKLANGYGLQDMLGNVWQWCQDWYGDYPAGPQTDPKGPETGEQKVYRGGSWNDGPDICRSAFRSKNALDSRFTNVGLRVVAVPRVP